MKSKHNFQKRRDVSGNYGGKMLMKISCAMLHIQRHLVLGLVSGQVSLHVMEEVEPPATDDTGVRFHHRPAPKRKSTQTQTSLRVHWHMPLKVGLRGEGAITLGTGNHLIG